MLLLGGFGLQLLAGALLTIELALASLVVGIPLGLLVGIGKLSSSPLLRICCFAYANTLRALPELLVILIVYFGVQQLLNEVQSSPIDIDPFAAGVAALALIFSAYASEVFRGAYHAVPKVQREAAMALGLSRYRVFRLVQLPQMWRFAVPSLGNLWLVMLKDTSLVAVIGLQELMRKAQVATATTKEAFLFYGAAALLYILISIVSSLIIAALNRRSQRGLINSGTAR